MSFLQVVYDCECKKERVIEELYFCESCVCLCCPSCSIVEIDSYFCPHCFSSYSTLAAAHEGYKCKQCVQCPLCTHVLTLVKDQKTFNCYFICNHCNWKSIQTGLEEQDPEKIIAKVISRENNSVVKEEFVKLIKKFRTIEQSSRKQSSNLGKEISLAGSLKLITNANKMIDSLKENTYNSIDELEQSISNKLSSSKFKSMQVISPSFPQVPEFLKDCLNYTNVSSYTNRLRYPYFYSGRMLDYYPIRVCLFTKQSYRCCKCRRYLIKPSAQPRSVSFDKRSLALNVLPKITFSSNWADSTETIVFFANKCNGIVRIRVSDPLGIYFNPISTVMNSYDVLAEHDVVSNKMEWIDDNDRKLVAYRKKHKFGIFSQIPSYESITTVSFKVLLEFDPECNFEFKSFEYFAKIILRNDK